MKISQEAVNFESFHHDGFSKIHYGFQITVEFLLGLPFSVFVCPCNRFKKKRKGLNILQSLSRRISLISWWFYPLIINAKFISEFTRLPDERM